MARSFENRPYTQSKSMQRGDSSRVELSGVAGSARAGEGRTVPSHTFPGGQRQASAAALSPREAVIQVIRANSHELDDVSGPAGQCGRPEGDLQLLTPGRYSRAAWRSFGGSR